MKKIEAFIKAHRPDNVTYALHHVERLAGLAACCMLPAPNVYARNGVALR